MRTQPKKPGRKKQDAGAPPLLNLIVLSLLKEKPMSGYDLLGEFDRQEVVDWAQVSRAQVYYVLKHLVADGCIEPSGPKQGPRKKSVFNLTQKGSDQLASMLANPTWAFTTAPPPFLTWLGLSIHTDPKAKEDILALRRRFLETEIKKKEEIIDFVVNYPSERAEMGIQIIKLIIANLRTEIDWLDTVVMAR